MQIRMIHNRIRVLWTAGLLAVLAMSVVGCKQLEARSKMKLGVQSFKGGDFETAAKLFKEAAVLDPTLKIAENYLATAYYQQYVKDKKDLASADKAVETFEKILKRDPADENAIDGIAGVYQAMKRYDKAREFYMKHTEVDPSSASAWYAVASLDWYIAAPSKETNYDVANPPDLETQRKLVDEGLQYIDKAIALTPDHADAMKFKSLLLLEKVRFSDAGSDDEVRYMNESKEWADKAYAARQKSEEKKSPGGIVVGK